MRRLTDILFTMALAAFVVCSFPHVPVAETAEEANQCLELKDMRGHYDAVAAKYDIKIVYIAHVHRKVAEGKEVTDHYVIWANGAMSLAIASDSKPGRYCGDHFVGARAAAQVMMYVKNSDKHRVEQIYPPTGQES